MRRWQWGLLGIGTALAGLGLWKREAILSYLSFDPENFVPDNFMVPYKPYDISGLLTKLGSYLLHVAPGGLPISGHIDQACSRNNVSPLWILVSLQREQSLLTLTNAEAASLQATAKTWREVGTDGVSREVNGNVLDYKLRWALGYAAYEGGFKPVDFGRPMAGIENQIREVAGWVGRNFPIEKGLVGKAVTRDGASFVIDGKLLNPKTAATRLAYRYTPHIEAGRLTWQIERKWFPEFLPA